MGAFGIIGAAWAGIKNLREIAAFLGSLNGWEVLLLLSLLALLAFGVVSYVEWLNRQFQKQQMVITDMSRRLGDYNKVFETFRNEAINWQNESLEIRTDFAKRIDKLEHPQRGGLDFIQPPAGD